MADTTAAPPVPVIDLDALKARCLGNLALVQRVLEKFTRQLDADLSEIERALSACDLPTIALVAHRIKGMSANVEARELFQSALVAEQCAQASDLAELPQRVAKLKSDQLNVLNSLGQINQAV
jgi:HPt (histidine-containing phosphotransfer) domain-containing protein